MAGGQLGVEVVPVWKRRITGSSIRVPAKSNGEIAGEANVRTRIMIPPALRETIVLHPTSGFAYLMNSPALGVKVWKL